jgi:hypothetical protein
VDGPKAPSKYGSNVRFEARKTPGYSKIAASMRIDTGVVRPRK